MDTYVGRYFWPLTFFSPHFFSLRERKREKDNYMNVQKCPLLVYQDTIC